MIGIDTLKGSKNTMQTNTSSLTDSFQSGSYNKSDSKQLFTPKDEKKPDNFHLEETKLALDTIFENPETVSCTEEDRESEVMEKKEIGLSVIDTTIANGESEKEGKH